MKKRCINNLERHVSGQVPEEKTSNLEPLGGGQGKNNNTVIR